MGRLSCLLLVALCVGAVTVRGDDPWFHDPFITDSPPPPAATPPPLYPAPVTPSPYYDAPPYVSPPYTSPPYTSPPVVATPPSYSTPIYSSPESFPPIDGPEPSYVAGSLWSLKTDSWPAPYSPDTPIGDAFGPDAVKVYGQVSMLDGILSKGDDGYSDLLKEGITALLNAADAHFKYSDDEIKKCFDFKTGLSSEAAATVQAEDFKAANEEYSS